MLEWRLRKGGYFIGQKAFKPKQIIHKLCASEVLISQGSTIAVASRQIGVTEESYYRWRREYCGLRVEQARRLRELEKKNARLKKLVADFSLDNAIRMAELLTQESWRVNH